MRRRLHGRARVRRAADEGDAIDPYQVLGVSPDASAEQIRGAYRRLARRCHPDVNPGVDATRFRVLNEAYRSLAVGGGGAPRDAARPEPAARADPPPNRPPDAASGHTGPPDAAGSPPDAAGSPPDAAGSPLVAAAVLVPLAVVVCAPGPLLLCGVLLAPVGVVLGHLARWQARRAGRPPSGLALVGIVAGWALTAVLVTAVVAGVLASRS